VDCGVFANNPTLSRLVEAKKELCAALTETPPASGVA